MHVRLLFLLLLLLPTPVSAIPAPLHQGITPCCNNAPENTLVHSGDLFDPGERLVLVDGAVAQLVPVVPVPQRPDVVQSLYYRIDPPIHAGQEVHITCTKHAPGNEETMSRFRVGPPDRQAPEKPVDVSVKGAAGPSSKNPRPEDIGMRLWEIRLDRSDAENESIYRGGGAAIEYIIDQVSDDVPGAAVIQSTIRNPVTTIRSDTERACFRITAFDLAGNVTVGDPVCADSGALSPAHVVLAAAGLASLAWLLRRRRA